LLEERGKGNLEEKREERQDAEEFKALRPTLSTDASPEEGNAIISDYTKEAVSRSLLLRKGKDPHQKRGEK